MDLKNPRSMYVKAMMLLIIGFTSFGLMLAESPSIKTALLCFLMIWAFSRSYYFAFYVIGKYIDPDYRFSGLIDFARYMMWKRRNRTDKSTVP